MVRCGLLAALLALCLGAAVAQALPTMTLNLTVAPGAAFAVHFTAPAGCTPTAWLGIVPAATPRGDEAANRNAALARQPLQGKAAGTLTFTAPQAPGAYDLRLYAGEGGAELSSSSFQVVAGAATPVGGLPKTFALTANTDHGVLTTAYPRTSMRMRLTVTFLKPGVILDTAGINAAPIGSFVLAVNADGTVNFNVYDPGRQSPTKVANGWHILRSATTLTQGIPGEVVVEVLPTEMTLQVQNGALARLALPTPLSGAKVVVGDVPDDDHWGTRYNIHPAMVGTVTVTEFGAIAGGAAPAPAGSFAGTWETGNWGTLTLQVDGNAVTGTYTHDNGRFKGTLSADGRTLTGWWSEAPDYTAPNNAGKCVLTLSADGRTFTGTWGYGDSLTGGDWNGTRTGAAAGPAPTPATPPPPPPPPAHFSGVWDTDFGTLTLKVDGTKVTGTYSHDNGKVEGTLSADGRTFTGKWSEAPDYAPPNNAGSFVLTLSADNQSFSGKWGYGDSLTGGSWNGKRK